MFPQGFAPNPKAAAAAFLVYRSPSPYPAELLPSGTRVSGVVTAVEARQYLTTSG
jgi:hypothetical protein